MLEQLRTRLRTAVEGAKLRAGVGGQSRALAEWHANLSRGFLDPLLARLAGLPLDETYMNALKVWAISAAWGVASMLGATAGERRWGQQKCFGRWRAYQAARPDDACEAATALFAWYLTAPGNSGRFVRHGDQLLQDLEHLAAPGPWARDFAAFALEMSRLEERGLLTARGPLLAALVFEAAEGSYPALDIAIERVRTWDQDRELSLADLVDWIPGLGLPDPALVLSHTNRRQGEVRNLRREHGSGEMFRLLAAALCGVELSRFLEALVPAVRDAYGEVPLRPLLRYSAVNGSLLNRSLSRPLTAGRGRPTPLGGLESDIALSGRLVRELQDREPERVPAGTAAN